MSRHALDVLEFSRVLDRVAEQASCALGAERIRDLHPSADAERVRRELARVGAVMRFVEEKPSWGVPTIPDVRASLGALAAEGSVLEPVALYALGQLLTASRLVAAELDRREARLEELGAVRDLLYEDGDAEETLQRSVDAEGQVLDTASRELKKIRDRLRGAHTRIVRQLEAYMRTLPERFVVADASVSIREGRYVVPIRREGRGDVGGIVHDASHTGATIFVEPPIAVELTNQLRDLEREEALEIRRILGVLTDRLRPVRDALRGALDALVDFDALHARARTALAWRASIPGVLDAGAPSLSIVRGRHPLLAAEGEAPVVPFDLTISEGERALVVSGPNTGGKSVFLKAVGLISALAQSGIVPPVDPGTRLPMFDTFFADIGDEQSIALSLSTFSAHLGNLSEIVRRADRRSMVLIDEMGTGTDPSEGAALARAVLEHLVERGALIVVTSHLGELKRLDTEGSGIVNASLQFDSERMEPTYQLVKGLPGRSYGLAIARRLGFPADVLDRAEGYRDRGEVEMEDLLGRLEHREREAVQLTDSLERERREVARLTEEAKKRERALKELERTAEERTRERARQVLLEARAEVEEAIREVRGASDAHADLEAASHEARRRVEDAVHRHRRRAPRSGKTRGPADVSAGDRVRVHATGAKGKVLEVRSDRAVVEVGALRLEVPLRDLETVSGGAPSPDAERGAGGWSGPEAGAVRLEVDLRGLRVDELEIELGRALDQAILEDLAELRIIHGKGTGALRQRVGELLELDTRVRSQRPGGPTEGGAGVTVAAFR
jgi:DNA mismatch repair protein MutS2